MRYALISPCRDEAAFLQRTIDTGQRLVNVPVEIQNRTGETIPISISTAVLFDRDGQHIGGVIGIEFINQGDNLFRCIALQ